MAFATVTGCAATVDQTDSAVVPADGAAPDLGSPEQDAATADVGVTDAGILDDAPVIDAALTDAPGGDAAREAGSCPGTGDVPRADAGEPHVVELSVQSQLHQCARMSDGTVRCRGFNRNGELGIGSSSDEVSDATTVPCLTNVQQVVTTNDVTCSRHGDGTVRCWGSNRSGLLGTGHGSDETCGSRPCRMSPTLVPGLTDTVFVAANDFSVCAVRRDGSVWCWGSPPFFMATESAVPVPIPGLNGVTALWSYGFETLLRRQDGDYAWSRRTSASNIPNDATIEGGGGSHTCYLRSDATVRCFGQNRDGALGNGESSSATSATHYDPGLRGVRSVVTGNYHTCAILTDRTVSCWGSNYANALGVTTSEQCPESFSSTGCATRPTPVPGVDNVERLFLGVWGTCALRTDHSVWCWGSLSPSLARPSVPVRVEW